MLRPKSTCKSRVSMDSAAASPIQFSIAISTARNQCSSFPTPKTNRKSTCSSLKSTKMILNLPRTCLNLSTKATSVAPNNFYMRLTDSAFSGTENKTSRKCTISTEEGCPAWPSTQIGNWWPAASRVRKPPSSISGTPTRWPPKPSSPLATATSLPGCPSPGMESGLSPLAAPTANTRSRSPVGEMRRNWSSGWSRVNCSDK